MLTVLNSRNGQYAALLTSLIVLVVAGGLNLNCGVAPSKGTVASAKVQEPEMRNPQGGLRFNRNDLRPAHVELSDTIRLEDGREAPVTRWREGGYQDARATFEDPANPNIATVRPGSRLYYEQHLYFVAEFRHPTSGNVTEMYYYLQIWTPYPDETSEPGSK